MKILREQYVRRTTMTTQRIAWQEKKMELKWCTDYNGVTMWGHEGTRCTEIRFKRANKAKWNRNRMANENKF